MITVIQLFNGEETRIVGHARTFGGAAKLLKSIMGAGEGWGMKVRGTVKDLAQVGAYMCADGWIFEFVAGNPRARRTITIGCEVL